jgi:hypothetical protein
VRPSKALIVTAASTGLADCLILMTHPTARQLDIVPRRC